MNFRTNMSLGLEDLFKTGLIEASDTFVTKFHVGAITDTSFRYSVGGGHGGTQFSGTGTEFTYDSDTSINGGQLDTYLYSLSQKITGGPFLSSYLNISNMNTTIEATSDPEFGRTLMDGNDTIEVDVSQTFDPRFPINISIDAKSGDDSVIDITKYASSYLGRTSSASIDLGTGDDQIQLNYSLVRFSITLGEGADQITQLAQLATDDLVSLRRIKDFNPAEDTIILPSNEAGTTIYHIVDTDAGAVLRSTGAITSDIMLLEGISLNQIQMKNGIISGKDDGGNGDDQYGLPIYGTDGKDVIYGTDENDLIYGGAGRDILSGKKGDDLIFGEAGNDYIYGAEGNDYLLGNDGIDSLDGDVGDDQLFGGADNDLLVGGYGNDRLFGETGDDLLFGQYGDDLLAGGKGNDKLDGGPGDDLLAGGEGDDILHGLQGDDQLFGDEGNDRLEGGDGNDFLYGGEGVDKLYGEAGNDVLHGGGGGTDLLNGGEGDDYLYGDAGNDQLLGKQGNDYLDGGDGGDFLSGGLGDDELFGGAGNDLLQVSPGIDSIDGGTGFDRLVYHEVIKDNKGVYFNLEAGLATGNHIGQTTIKNVENAYGTIGDDVIIGNAGNNVLFGGFEGNDSLYGGGGNDQLIAHNGNDQLHGEDGNDRLAGGNGSDYLYGDAGNDLLLGGDGEDYLGGGSGNDDLIAGSGNDLLEGGAGNDFFAAGIGNDEIHMGEGNDYYLLQSDGHGTSFGADVIKDFDVLNDLIIFESKSVTADTISSFFQQTGEGLLIEVDNSSVLLHGVTADDLNTSSNFEFG